jgi:hypothetical protein
VTLQWREQNVIKRVPHPPCFPDLAPSGFYLFCYIKQLLLGYEFADRDSLLRAVSGILKFIKKSTSAGIFGGWMERLRQGSVTGAVTKIFLPTEFDETHPVLI